MDGRRGKLRALVSLVVATAFTVFLWALQEAEVIDANTAAYVLVVSGLLVVAGAMLKVWLDRRHELSDERPIIPAEMYFREEPEVLHRPSADPDAPYHHVVRLGLKEMVSPVVLEVRTNKPVQAVKGNIYRDAELEQEFDRAIAALGTRRWRGVFGEAMKRSMTLDKGVRWATIAFDDDVLATTADNLDVIAWGASEELRVTRVRLVRPHRGR